MEVASKVLRSRRNCFLMLDIGANVGQPSLALHNFVDKIVAVMPNPQVERRFILNIRQKQIKSIELNQVALGDADECAELGLGIEGNDGSRSFNWTQNATKNIKGDVRSAARFFLSAIAQNQIDHVKMNV